LFQVKESVRVHCGFYSENGGFQVSDDDKEYMRSCVVVVTTCAFGGGDDLHQPIGMTENSISKVFMLLVLDVNSLQLLSCFLIDAYHFSRFAMLLSGMKSLVWLKRGEEIRLVKIV
jgi:hypothetical protein